MEETKKPNMRVMQHKWRELPFEKWNTNTVYAYLCDKHREVQGIDYFASRGVTVDKKLLRDFINKHGKELTVQFIDRCLKEYKGNAKFRVCTFQFMSTYMVSQIMPQLQIDQQRAQDVAQAKEEDYEEVQF